MSIDLYYPAPKADFVDAELSALLIERTNLVIELERERKERLINYWVPRVGKKNDFSKIARKDKEILDRIKAMKARLVEERAEAEKKRKNCSCNINWSHVFQSFGSVTAELAPAALLLAGLVSEVVYQYFPEDHSSRVPYALVTLASIVDWMQRRISKKIAKQHRLDQSIHRCYV